MTLVKCRVCKKDVIETADKCPHCDSLGPKKSRRVTWIMVGVLIVLAACMGGMIYKRSQEKVPTHEEVEDIRRAEKIHQRMMSATFLLKTGVADPAAFRVDDVKTNIDGSVLCYQYSLKESNGRYLGKKAVFAEGDFHYSPGSWEIYCQPDNVGEVPDKPQPLD
ncbi:MAG: hypothetical protein NC112_08900 [Oxalobacter formigenes]|nr:hypothetical protein [Oxalobacter formigenes]MCM1281472.1 hypothetical protein [Alistipes senegalensis]MCM1513205.1 hypothetical protein [Oxalobacter formigenes]